MKEKKILLVDDDKLTQKDYAKIFESTVYGFDVATDSVEGLRKIKNTQYDLILLDIIMPDLRNRQSNTAGFELLDVIRNLKPDLPIVMITAVDEVKSAVNALKSGANDYIVKDSITTEELVHKVNEILKSDRDPLRKLINKGESSNLEFKSTIRQSLKNNKPEKWIEFSWLKTIVAFLNTDGGTLLIGVSDDGSILGIGADKFPNEDKFQLHFNNLVLQHIGPEFNDFISAELVPIDDQKILLVECTKSDKPVFLKKSKNEDEFYIRSGPSSRKLSMSQMWNYLGGR